MKKIVFAAAVAALLSAPAFAAQTNDGCQGNCTGGTTTNAGGAGGTGIGVGIGQGGAGGAGGAGGQGGTAIGQGGTGYGGNVLGSGNSDNRNTNTANGGSVLGSGNSNNSNRNDNTNLNANSNKQGQGQAQGQAQGQLQGQQQGQIAQGGDAKQGQGQSQNSRNDNRSSASNKNSNAAQGNTTETNVKVTGDTVTYEAARIPVATAYAAGLTASNGTCMGSTSAGGQGMSFGFSVGTTWKDPGCDRRYNAQSLAAVGQPKAAVALLCQDPDIKAAMETAGTPCSQTAAEAKATAQAKAETEAVAASEPLDPLVRSRIGLPPLASVAR